MKIRTDFVTNSSSSSFIIDRKDCSFGKLIKCLKEMSNKEMKFYGDCKFKLKDLDYDEEEGELCISNYWIKCTTDKNPYSPIGEFIPTLEDYIKAEEEEYNYLFCKDPIANKPRTKQDIFNTAKRKYEKAKKKHDDERLMWSKYNHHYVISSKRTVHYDMNIVNNVLKKHRIPFELGYCD